MTVETINGGTASLTSGLDALKQLAPSASAAFDTMIAVRPSGVHDEVLESPGVRAYATQFRTGVSEVDETMRNGLNRAAGDRLGSVSEMVFIGDVAPRVRAALDALFGASPWDAPRRYPVARVSDAIGEFLESVARLQELDPLLTELIRLRGARLNGSRIARSRRSLAAIEAGATDATFAGIDVFEDTELPEATKAALALVDAMTWTPDELPESVVARVREHLSDAQVVEVVLDVARNAADKIAVGLGSDAAEVEDGVQLFSVDLDGTVSTV